MSSTKTSRESDHKCIRFNKMPRILTSNSVCATFNSFQLQVAVNGSGVRCENDEYGQENVMRVKNYNSLSNQMQISEKRSQ